MPVLNFDFKIKIDFVYCETYLVVLIEMERDLRDNK